MRPTKFNLFTIPRLKNGPKLVKIDQIGYFFGSAAQYDSFPVLRLREMGQVTKCLFKIKLVAHNFASTLGKRPKKWPQICEKRPKMAQNE